MTRADDTPVPDYGGLLRLDGRRFIVAGAGQGIGRQATHALANVGARVLCVDIIPERAVEVAAEVGGTPWTGDVRDRSDVERLIADTHHTLGGLDGVIDIVGISRYGPLLDTDDEDWTFHHDNVLHHAWLFIQTAGRAMRDSGGGVMVFVASASGLTGAPMHAPYGAAKAGLMSLVRSAAVELGPVGIRVNAVAPGVVWTPRVSALLGEEGRRRNSDNTPLRRVALPADIASCLLFLASDLSGYVNGQTLVCDGGVSAKFPYPMPDVV
jgi:NAD(P)-dependent dehydrogenase (short-subunit alcohol dehydrogenase family)